MELKELLEKNKILLVGRLNRVYGTKGYLKNEIGTEVYEEDGKYFIFLTPENEKLGKVKQYYYKDRGFEKDFD